MSLNWNLADIADCEAICYIGEGNDRELTALTNGLIWYTMICDMGSITEKNWPDFYQRIKLVERLIGSVVCDGNGKDVLMTPGIVKAHVGLRTNVSNIALSKWQNRILKDFMAKRQRDYCNLITGATNESYSN